MSESNGNGGRAIDGAHVEQIVLTYDRQTDELTIAGNTMSNESGMAMLERAKRAYDVMLRTAAVAGMVQQRQDAELTRKILSDSRGGRG